MAKGFKKGASGANPLNFKVVGGTVEPSNPRENTIWVPTETDIANWIFSATEPTELAEGLVWFRMGTESKVQFNVLKKNCIMVYPIATKQYVGEAWADVTASFYQGGEWVSLENVTYLYNKGDDCASVTGGWESYAYNLTGSNYAPTLTMGGTTMTIGFRSYTGGAVASEDKYYNGSVWTENAVDFSDFATLFVQVDGMSGVSDGYFKLHLASNKKDGFTSVKSMNISTTGVHSLDVSDLAGAYYVVFANNNNKPQMTVTIAKVFCEQKV